MKKTVLALGLLAGATVSAQAQSSSFGIKAGASLTSYTGSSVSDAKYLFGFHGGLVANFAVNDLFSVQPELLYSMKGAKAENSQVINGTRYYANLTERLHYIDVPVLARFNASGLFFEVGPQIGFVVAANDKYDSNIIGSGDMDIKDQINTVDFGYAAGLGYQLANGPGIGLRYNGGFTDVYKGSNSSATRNSAFQLYLSYMFGGK